MFGINNSLITKLQRIQNAAARLIYRRSRYDHITSDLVNLHWLPIKERIDFKLLLLTYKSLHGMVPLYLSELICQYVPSRQGLRSSDASLLAVPRSHLITCGDKAFSVAAPRLWNSLPLRIRHTATCDIFQAELKTHLFRKAYYCN